MKLDMSTQKYKLGLAKEMRKIANQHFQHAISE